MVRVKISQGELLGFVRATAEGFAYNSYLGIPYAKPPIGDLRFKSPEPPEPWEGVRNAMLFGKINPQLASADVIDGDEDSLFLNVYAPASALPNSRLPVMVWIHGGGFVNGSGNDSMYGPDHLIQEDVIVVTFNYRLGALGFLCLNTTEVPGNAGLKDQVFALRWIRDNIENFGGDPCNVTVFGESAGAASVHYLLLSGMARGLFKRAILQSGSALARWASQKDAETNAYNLAKSLGFKSADKSEVLRFLQSMPVKKLMFACGSVFSVFDINTFLPVIEQEFAGVESIINKDPLQLMKNGEYNQVPCIWGHNSNEGYSFFMEGIRDLPSMYSAKDVARTIEALLPCHIKNNVEITDTVSKVQSLYFTDDEISHSYARLFGDLSFTIDINQSINTMIKDTVYFYNFGYSGSLNLLKPNINVEFSGATHADELGYIFKQDTSAEPNPSDISVRKWMIEIDPTPASKIWKPYVENKTNCLEITDKLTMVQNPNAEYFAFWNGMMK